MFVIVRTLPLLSSSRDSLLQPTIEPRHTVKHILVENVAARYLDIWTYVCNTMHILCKIQELYMSRETMFDVVIHSSTNSVW